MTISFWLDEQQSKPKEEYDVAIIGGGITGASAAYWLSKRKNLKVVVVESQKPAIGASGRNGGFILRGIVAYYSQAVKQYGRENTKWVFKFNEDTQKYLAEFIAEHGNTFRYEPCGSYLLAASLDELQDLQESVELMHEDGFASDYIKEDPINRGFYGAVFNKCDGGVHPAMMVKALLAASRAQVYTAEPVFNIERNVGGKTILQTPNRLIAADRVLLTTNAYSPLLEPWFLNKVMPIRGQILVTKPLSKRILNNVCYANYGYEYFRQLPDNRFLLGGRREHFADDEIGYADMVTKPVQDALQTYLKDKFPDVAGHPIEYRWSGIMAFTVDGLPLVGELPEHKGTFFAAGCNGHGMGYSLAMGRLLVDVALDGASANIFDWQRKPFVSVPDAEPLSI